MFSVLRGLGLDLECGVNFVLSAQDTAGLRTHPIFANIRSQRDTSVDSKGCRKPSRSGGAPPVTTVRGARIIWHLTTEAHDTHAMSADGAPHALDVHLFCSTQIVGSNISPTVSRQFWRQKSTADPQKRSSSDRYRCGVQH